MASLLQRSGRLAASLATRTVRTVATAGPGRLSLQEGNGALETALLSNVRARQHELLFTFKAPLVAEPNRHTLQYSTTEHLCAVKNEDGQAFTDASSAKSSGDRVWVFMNHAFHLDASVYLRPVDHRHIDPAIGCVAVYAAKDMVPGEPLAFDYTLIEWEMSTPFHCHATGRSVQGFKHLTEEEQLRALPHAWAHVRQLRDEHLGLSSSLTGLQSTGAGSSFSWMREGLAA